MKRITVFLVITIAVSFGLISHTQVSDVEYSARITDYHNVYDGDTIQDVRIKVMDLVIPVEKQGEVWPGIFLRINGVYTETDVRIAGIDTPEKRPLKKWRDGTERSETVRNAEREAAEHARQTLIGLIEDADGVIIVKNPQLGKYAGRIVADIYVKDSERDLINVSEYLIENGHAYSYDGGRKKEFHSVNLWR